MTMLELFLLTLGQMLGAVLLVLWTAGVLWAIVSLGRHMYKHRAQIRQDRQDWRNSNPIPYRHISKD